MVQETSKHANRIIVAVIAAATIFTAALLAAPAAQAVADEGQEGLTVAPLTTQADDTEYFITFSGVPYEAVYGIVGMPGEKLVIKANAYYLDENYASVAAEGATVKWKSASKQLNATIKGNKLIIQKLPKPGTYKIKAVAFNADGEKIATQIMKIFVKKKPVVKIKMPVYGETGLVSKNGSSTTVGKMNFIKMDGASFAWDNNTKKPFYTWTVKNLKTGKVATWNTKKSVFKKNAFISNEPTGGASIPILVAKFKKAGTYKITATVYHSNKKIATATKTITVKSA